jgi:hypothetical protein
VERRASVWREGTAGWVAEHERTAGQRGRCRAQPSRGTCARSARFARRPSARACSQRSALPRCPSLAAPRLSYRPPLLLTKLEPLDLERVGRAAREVVGLHHRHVVAVARQQPGAAQACRGRVWGGGLSNSGGGCVPRLFLSHQLASTLSRVSPHPSPGLPTPTLGLGAQRGTRTPSAPTRPTTAAGGSPRALAHRRCRCPRPHSPSRGTCGGFGFPAAPKSLCLWPGPRKARTRARTSRTRVWGGRRRGRPAAAAHVIP